jgi:hypothetical protein
MALTDRRAQGNYTIAVKSTIIGAQVVNAAKEDLGKIEDLIIDARSSVVVYAILSFGGFLGLGDKRFAIPWRVLDFHAPEGYAVLNMDKERLKNAPGFKADEWPDMSTKEWVNSIDDHFGTR